MAINQLERPTGEFSKTEKGILLFNKRVYIPIGLQKELVSYKYGLPAYRYQGIRKTLECISRSYYFPGIRKTVKEVVTSYNTYIRNKAARHAPYGQMRSPLIPSQL
jgi:hypothetical protein